MRVNKPGTLSVKAIAGTRVVLMALDLDPGAAQRPARLRDQARRRRRTGAGVPDRNQVLREPRPGSGQGRQVFDPGPPASELPLVGLRREARHPVHVHGDGALRRDRRAPGEAHTDLHDQDAPRARRRARNLVQPRRDRKPGARAGFPEQEARQGRYQRRRRGREGARQRGALPVPRPRGSVDGLHQRRQEQRGVARLRVRVHVRAGSGCV
jgi:hypothetical protein